MYGVAVCKRCDLPTGIRSGVKTATCQNCGKTFSMKDRRLFAQVETSEELALVIQKMKAEMAARRGESGMFTRASSLPLKKSRDNRLDILK